MDSHCITFACIISFGAGWLACNVTRIRCNWMHEMDGRE